MESQVCGACQEVLPVAAFYPSHRGGDGRWCKPCRKVYMKERYERLKGPSKFKLCPGCKRRRRSSSFSPDRWQADGLASACKFCQAERWRIRTGGKKRKKGTSYGVVHTRLRTERGSASEHECSRCGERARHWAYDGLDPNELEGKRENGSGELVAVLYSVKLEHYRPLCVRCHNHQDHAWTIGFMIRRLKARADELTDVDLKELAELLNERKP